MKKLRSALLLTTLIFAGCGSAANLNPIANTMPLSSSQSIDDNNSSYSSLDSSTETAVFIPKQEEIHEPFSLDRVTANAPDSIFSQQNIAAKIDILSHQFPIQIAQRLLNPAGTTDDRPRQSREFFQLITRYFQQLNPTGLSNEQWINSGISHNNQDGRQRINLSRYLYRTHMDGLEVTVDGLEGYINYTSSTQMDGQIKWQVNPRIAIGSNILTGINAVALEGITGTMEFQNTNQKVNWSLADTVTIQVAEGERSGKLTITGVQGDYTFNNKSSGLVLTNQKTVNINFENFFLPIEIIKLFPWLESSSGNVKSVNGTLVADFPAGATIPTRGGLLFLDWLSQAEFIERIDLQIENKRDTRFFMLNELVTFGITGSAIKLRTSSIQPVIESGSLLFDLNYSDGKKQITATFENGKPLFTGEGRSSDHSKMLFTPTDDGFNISVDDFMFSDNTKVHSSSRFKKQASSWVREDKLNFFDPSQTLFARVTIASVLAAPEASGALLFNGESATAGVFSISRSGDIHFYDESGTATTIQPSSF